MNGNVKKKSKSEKKAGQFSAVDVILILLALLVLGGAALLWLPSSSALLGREKSVTIEYTVEITNVKDTFIRNVVERDSVMDSVSKHPIGTVSSVENSTPYTVLHYDDATDSVEMKEYPDAFNLLITIRAEASFVEGVGYTVNDYRIAVGKEMALKVPEFVGTGHCISIREVR